MAPRGYPAEFRRHVIDLVESGRPVAAVAAELVISDQSICTCRRQARIDAGLEPGMTTAEHGELVALRKRGRERRDRAGDPPPRDGAAEGGAGPRGGSRPSG